MAGAAIDFLFSVINPVLLSAEVLAWPTRMAINYHDGPLPRYAGVHATSWAILNGETVHGVTWHVMAAKPDAGGLLKQVAVPILPRDTAFDLNLRCHEAAMASFGELLGELVAGTARVMPQTAANRTYFAAAQKDVDGGVVRWTDSAERIDRVIRAHTLGPIVTNDFGLPKINLANGFFVPTDVEILGQASGQLPGTVIADDSGALVIATGTNNARISRVATLAGEAFATPDVLHALGIKAGERLPNPEAAETCRVARLCREAWRHEPFCATAITAAVQTASPFTGTASATRTQFELETRSDGAAGLEMLRLAVLVWLARSAEDTTISVRYSTDGMDERAAGAEEFIRSDLPLTIAVPPAQKGRDIAGEVAIICSRIESRGVYPRDLPLRYKLATSGDDLPIAVHVGDRERPDQNGRAQLLVRIMSGGRVLRLESTPAEHWRAHSSDDLKVIASQVLATRDTLMASFDSPIGELDFLTPAERQTVLGFNARSSGELPTITVPELFEEQVPKTPERIAVVINDRSLTYAELNDSANEVAHQLIAAEVRPGALVGVCVPRSLEMIVAVVGCLKAGGAYVPISADIQPTRLNHVLQDTGLKHVITTTENQALFAASVDHVVIADVNAGRPRTQGNPHVALKAGDPAYVNYTSGSTGVPKGVLVPHRGIVRLIRDPDVIHSDRSSCVLQAASLSFDAATYEIWGALLNGHTLALLPPGPVTPQDIQATIARHGVDTLFLTTALFNQVVEQALQTFATVRHVLTGGEAISPAHAKRLKAAYPHCRLTNAYGPTENTTFSTIYDVPADVDASLAVPIGRPIAHSRAYVLDSAHRPMPVGITGELYVAGAGLAIGYLNRPELTADRFIADPFAEHPGGLMYRTGDLARWDSEGRLHFVGRVDRQVKIRGFRIEPGEIEAAINAHPAVTGCAVMPRDDGPAGHRLVAYIVPASVDSVEVRRFIAERLPEYMLPAAWVGLSALPLSPTGKLDVRALPDPQRQATGVKAGATPTESRLCELMAETLGLASVDREDDFFEIGGHSLLAIQFAARVRDVLNVDLAVRTLFEHPSVARLAPHLTGASRPRPTLVRRDRPDRLPLSSTQRRLWFLQQLNGPSATYNIVLAHRLEGEVHAAALEAALRDVVARHESLRTIFPDAAGVPYQHILSPEVAGPRLAIEHCDEANLAATLTEHANVAIDLSSEQPLRSRLLRLSPRHHVLLIVLHHIAGDGWSLRPFWADLSQAYAARCHGRPPALAELAIQYADYTLWQRDLLGDAKDRSSVANQQLRFWQSALAGAPLQSTIEPDFPRPDVARYRGANAPVRIAPDLHAQLLALGRSAGASLFMVLQAGLAALLSKEGCGADVVIGSPVAGRSERELGDQIGFFVNTIALRVNLSGTPSFRELIARARAFTIDAFAHQDMPFDEVVQAVQPVRSLSR
ncbi:MAG: hypothetical protein JWM57_3920, partial [Phycisphaerales bacterium]|nr:hypothetical protein [Phycisphaerales bacterium]